jgi:hypothetical protein
MGHHFDAQSWTLPDNVIISGKIKKDLPTLRRKNAEECYANTKIFSYKEFGCVGSYGGV